MGGSVPLVWGLGSKEVDCASLAVVGGASTLTFVLCRCKNVQVKLQALHHKRAS